MFLIEKISKDLANFFSECPIKSSVLQIVITQHHYTELLYMELKIIFNYFFMSLYGKYC